MASHAHWIRGEQPRSAARRRLSAVALLASFALAGGLAGCAPATTAGAAFQLAIQPAADDPTRVVVRLSTDSPGALRSLAATRRSAREWERLFFLALQSHQSQALVPMLGEYALAGDAIELRPQVALVPGATYVAVFAPPDGQRRQTEYVVPEPPASADGPAVAIVYPIQDVLPQNMLRFYVHFTEPMGAGRAVENVALLDAQGAEIPEALRAIELWNDDHTRLTVWIQPGRTKRGLIPNMEQGPVLQEGGQYALLIRDGLRDARDRPLVAPHRTEFRAGPPDYDQPRMASWSLAAPRAGSREPLRATFPDLLDHAMLQRSLWVERDDGQRVAGAINVGDDCLSWSFTPHAPWPGGEYALVAAVELEDPVGNNLDRPFEVLEGTRAPQPASPTQRLTFRAAAGGAR